MGYKKKQNFRVRTPVKSFRDLEVYQESTKLSAQIFNLKSPTKYKKALEEEMENLRQTSKIIPKMIVESYSDKFEDFKLADKKLETACQAVNLIVAKLDFLSAVVEDENFRGLVSEISKKYQRVKMKTLNLKRAWGKVFNKEK